MTPSGTSITIDNHQRPGRPLTLALFVLLGCAPAALGQTVIAPLQSDSQYPAQQPGRQTQSRQPSAVATSTPPPAGLQWGPLTSHPRLAYRFISSTGVQSSPGHAVNTTIQTLSPGVLTEVGAHWSLDYQPSWTYYSSSAFKDTVDHALSLIGATEYEDWTLRFSQNYSRTFAPLIETGQQTREETYTTDFNARYRIDSRFSLESSANQALRYTSDFNDSKEWKLVEWLHLQLSPRLDTAIGAGPGYVEINNASDINYFQFLGKIDWRPGDKLDVHLEAGVDHRKTRTRDAGYANNPTTNASVRYQIFEHTVLSAGIARTISVPYFANQTLKVLSWNTGLEQRLLGKFLLNLSAGQQESDYLPTGPASFGKRSDRSHWYDARLSAPVLQRATLSVFYHYNRNSSSEPGYSFSSGQTGVELQYHY